MNAFESLNNEIFPRSYFHCGILQKFLFIFIQLFCVLKCKVLHSSINVCCLTSALHAGSHGSWIWCCLSCTEPILWYSHKIFTTPAAKFPRRQIFGILSVTDNCLRHTLYIKWTCWIYLSFPSCTLERSFGLRMCLESSQSDYIMSCCLTKSGTNYTQIVSAHLIKFAVQIAGILMLHMNQAKSEFKKYKCRFQSLKSLFGRVQIKWLFEKFAAQDAAT